MKVMAADKLVAQWKEWRGGFFFDDAVVYPSGRKVGNEKPHPSIRLCELLDVSIDDREVATFVGFKRKVEKKSAGKGKGRARSSSSAAAQGSKKKKKK